MDGVVYKPYKPQKERSIFYIVLLVAGVLLILYGSVKLTIRVNLKNNGVQTVGKVILGSHRHSKSILDSVTIAYKVNAGQPDEQVVSQSFLTGGYYPYGKILTIYYDAKNPDHYIIKPAFDTWTFTILGGGIIVTVLGLLGTIFGWKVTPRKKYGGML